MLEGQNPLAITAGRKEKFKRQRLTGDAIDPLLSVDHPSGLRQQGVSFKKIFAIVAVAVRDRRLIDLSEDFRRKIFFIGASNTSSSASG